MFFSWPRKHAKLFDSYYCIFAHTKPQSHMVFVLRCFPSFFCFLKGHSYFDLLNVFCKTATLVLLYESNKYIVKTSPVFTWFKWTPVRVSWMTLYGCWPYSMLSFFFSNAFLQWIYQSMKDSFWELELTGPNKPCPLCQYDQDEICGQKLFVTYWLPLVDQDTSPRSLTKVWTATDRLILSDQSKDMLLKWTLTVFLPIKSNQFPCNFCHTGIIVTSGYII